MVIGIGELKNLAQLFEVELYLTSKNGGLNNGLFTINDGHVGIKEPDCFFVDNIFHVEKGSRPY